ncbi:MAG: RNA 2',3'-cyclic phosphodiesterase [Chlorobi bacterium]|nr:RNA 2',3'-cyclic phosphodiesterase [Chlorobiota bacterium]
MMRKHTKSKHDGGIKIFGVCITAAPPFPETPHPLSAAQPEPGGGTHFFPYHCPMNNLPNAPQPLHRCFFAVKFSAQIEEYVAAMIQSLRGHGADVAWTPQRNLHLTLRFLGEINRRQLQQIQQLPAGALLPLGFRLRAAGLGAFPTLRSARILWTGVEGETPEHRQQLSELQRLTEGWAREIGLAPEGRRYTPHLTLGRVRNPSPGLRTVVDAMTVGECLSPFCSIAELLLMQSNLTERGVEYEVVGRWGG